jgi:hypothetical protein
MLGQTGSGNSLYDEEQQEISLLGFAPAGLVIMLLFSITTMLAVRK